MGDAGDGVSGGAGGGFAAGRGDGAAEGGLAAGVHGLGAGGGREVRERKQFFFEKKNQKTFPGASRDAGTVARSAQTTPPGPESPGLRPAPIG